MTQNTVIEYRQEGANPATVLKLSEKKIEIPLYDISLENLRTLRCVLNHVLAETRFADKVQPSHIDSLAHNPLPPIAHEGQVPCA